MEINGYNVLTQSLKSAGTSALTKSDTEAFQLREACQDFEAIFLREVLKNLRSLSPTLSTTRSDPGGWILWDLASAQLAEQLSDLNALGFGQELLRQFQSTDSSVAD